MFNWLSGFYVSDILFFFSGLFLLDSPRYLFSKIFLLLFDFFHKERKHKLYVPSVCAIISCLNEGETIYQTLESIYGSYPNLEIIVIDDGSTDDTYSLAMKFYNKHKDIIVLKRPIRGGKSSAINLALRYTQCDIVLTLDSDSEYDRDSIWKIVQPLRDEKVAAVSGAVLVRNPFDSVCSQFQSYEYLSSILVGRQLSSKLGMLGIASGAFAAFRRKAVLKGYGWDTGPGEDADITLRLRKEGFDVVFEPSAICYTNAPVKFKQLFKQRLRWDRSLVRYKIKKHKDIANPLMKNFRWSNFIYWWDVLFFNVISSYTFWIFGLWLFLANSVTNIIHILSFTLFAYMFFGIIQTIVILYYSPNLKRDIKICLLSPFYVFYALFLRMIRTYAIYDELVYKSSYQDNYVPTYVRESTIHW